MKHYRGSCHCKRVQFEADIDWSKGTGKCNCTHCFKNRFWSVRVDPQSFKALQGAEEMSGYKSGDPKSASGFCRHCGVITYGYSPVSDWNPKEYVSVSVSALDELDPADVIAAPVTYFDGLHDNWYEKPTETRHL